MTLRAILLAFLTIGSIVSARAEDVTVSAAISLKESLEAIRPNYESSSNGDRVKLNFGGSGQLAAQIQNGAPVDLFVSASRKEVDALEKAGKADDATATPIIGNELVLIVPADAKSPPAGFDDLTKLHRIAIGEPKTVPAGEYAHQTLDYLKLTDKLAGKLVYGMNVRQVLQYVSAGEVDAGLVYLSDAQQAGKQVKVIARAQPEWHQPILYWGVVITGSPHADAAKRLLAYLKTEPAQRILHAKGFTDAAGTSTTAPAK